MSSKADVSIIAKDFGDVSFESFILKAAQKAFSKAVNDMDLSVSTVKGAEVKMVSGVNKLRVGQINDAAQSVTDEQFITVH